MKTENDKSDLKTDFRWTFTVGDQRTYKVNQKVDIRFQQNNQENATQIKVSGQLIEKVYHSSNQGVLLGVSLKDPVVNLSSNATQSNKMKPLLDSLKTQIYVKISQNRRVEYFFLPNGYVPEAANFIKSIFLTSQIIISSETSQYSDFNKQLREKNMTGPYLAEYEFKDEDAETIILNKRILEYGALDPLEDMEVPEILVLPGSQYTIVLKKTGHHLKSIKHLEKALINSMSMNIFSNVETDFEFLSYKRLDNLRSISLDDKHWAQKKFFKEKISKNLNSPEARKKMFLKRLGGMTTEEIFEKLEGLNFKKEGQEGYTLFRKLSALLNLYPEELSKIISKIESLDTNTSNYPHLISTFFGAISTMEAKYAENELMEIIRSKQSNLPILEQAFAALSDLKNPTLKGKNFLETSLRNSDRQEVYSLSALSLGTLGNMAKETSGEIFKSSSKLLIEELNNASSREKTLTVLTALGNHGTSEVLSILNKYIGSSDPSIKQSAILTLSNMQGIKAKNFLKDLLNNEKSLDGRKTAVQVLRSWRPSRFQLQTAQKLFHKEKDVDIKISALNIVSNNAKYYKKDSMDFLRSIKRQTKDKKIKDAVTGILLTH